MALEPGQIERVREIIGFTSFEATETLAGNLNAVQETETVADVAQWEIVRNKFTKIEGGKLGVVIDKEFERLAIRNRVRVRLGLSPLTSEDDLIYVIEEPAFAVGCSLEDSTDYC